MSDVRKSYINVLLIGDYHIFRINTVNPVYPPRFSHELMKDSKGVVRTLQVKVVQEIYWLNE